MGMPVGVVSCTLAWEDRTTATAVAEHTRVAVTVVSSGEVLSACLMCGLAGMLDELSGTTKVASAIPRSVRDNGVVESSSIVESVLSYAGW